MNNEEEGRKTINLTSNKTGVFGKDKRETRMIDENCFPF